MYFQLYIFADAISEQNEDKKQDKPAETDSQIQKGNTHLRYIHP